MSGSLAPPLNLLQTTELQILFLFPLESDPCLLPCLKDSEIISTLFWRLFSYHNLYLTNMQPLGIWMNSKFCFVFGPIHLKVTDIESYVKTIFLNINIYI